MLVFTWNLGTGKTNLMIKVNNGVLYGKGDGWQEKSTKDLLGWQKCTLSSLGIAQIYIFYIYIFVKIHEL